MVKIEKVLKYIQNEWPGLAKPVPVEGLPPMVFVCSFSSEAATEDELSSLGMGCPPDLAEFWSRFRTVNLFEDQEYGQWGLVIFSPEQAVESTGRFRDMRARDFVEGDLVIGEFLGDQDLLVIRCDQESEDYGRVLVALPIDPRVDWYEAADTFAELLDQFARSGGEKYWV